MLPCSHSHKADLQQQVKHHPDTMSYYSTSCKGLGYGTEALEAWAVAAGYGCGSFRRLGYGCGYGGYGCGCCSPCYYRRCWSSGFYWISIWRFTVWGLGLLWDSDSSIACMLHLSCLDGEPVIWTSWLLTLMWRKFGELDVGAWLVVFWGILLL